MHKIDQTLLKLYFINVIYVDFLQYTIIHIYLKNILYRYHFSIHMEEQIFFNLTKILSLSSSRHRVKSNVIHSRALNAYKREETLIQMRVI